MNRLLSLTALLLLGLPALAEQTGRIEGRAMIGMTPARSVRVLVERYEPGSQKRATRETTTDAEGRFVLGDVPAGTYRVSRLTLFDQKTVQGSSQSGTGTHGVRAKVTAGGTASVTIGGSGRTVVGQLAAGEGLAGRRLAYTAGDFRFLTLKEASEDGFPGRHLVLRIGEDGVFQCEDVPPGEYVLYVTVKDREGRLDDPDIGSVSRTLVVPADEGGKPHDVGRVEVRAVPGPKGEK